MHGIQMIRTKETISNFNHISKQLIIKQTNIKIKLSCCRICIKIIIKKKIINLIKVFLRQKSETAKYQMKIKNRLCYKETLYFKMN